MRFLSSLDTIGYNHAHLEATELIDACQWVLTTAQLISSHSASDAARMFIIYSVDSSLWPWTLELHVLLEANASVTQPRG